MPTNAVSGASCAISTPGQPSDGWTDRQEYRHQSTTDPATGTVHETVTIESQHSSPFRIMHNIHPTACDLLQNSTRKQFRATVRLHDIVVELSLDGVPVQCRIHHKSHQPRPVYAEGVRETDTLRRPFQFAPIKLVDPDDHAHQSSSMCQDEKIIKDLGTIKIKCFKCRLVPARPSSARYIPQTSNDMSFSELLKKAHLSSTAGVGQPTLPTHPPPPAKYSISSRDPHPFLQFTFNYKPRSVLIAEGTLPSPPTPPPQPAPEATSTRPERNSQPKTKKSDGNYITIDSDDNKSDARPTIAARKENEQKPDVKKEDQTAPTVKVKAEERKQKRAAEGAAPGGSAQKRSRASDAEAKPAIPPSRSDVKPRVPICIDLTD